MMGPTISHQSCASPHDERRAAARDRSRRPRSLMATTTFGMNSLEEAHKSRRGSYIGLVSSAVWTSSTIVERQPRFVLFLTAIDE